jgi:uncharacterized protein YbaP (TraB family)
MSACAWASCRRAALAALLCLVRLSALADAPATCPAAAQTPSAAQAQTGLANAPDRGFLWRIRKDGHDSWLYGTVHVGRPGWVFPGATVLNALRDSDLLALELDLMDPGIVARLQAGMAWRPDRAVSGSLAERLAAQVRAACLPEQLLTLMTPEMVATTLTMTAARRDGLDPAYAIDTAMSGVAQRLHKPVVSLETPELQLALLQSRSADEARDAVAQMLAELESGRAEPMLVRVAQVWAQGRWDELEHYGDWCECLRTDEERAQYTRLLDARNPGLAERIDALHTSGQRVFAAVGSLHMIGRTGLPALLARRGYTVERIVFE